MLEKNMLVEDGWALVEPHRHHGETVERVRVAKDGRKLYLNRLIWVAMGMPESVRVLCDRARCRVALEPATAGDDLAYALRRYEVKTTSRELEFGSLSRGLGLVVDRAKVVPHQLEGFRLIVDLRGLRPKEEESTR